MKKLLFSGLAVLTLVGSSLALKAGVFGNGDVYCTSTCTAASKIDFRINSAGLNTIPCGVSLQPYVLKGDTDCVPTDPGTHFLSTGTGK